MSDQPLAPTLDTATWDERFVQLHTQLFATEMPEFDDVMMPLFQQPEGYILADHCVVRHEDLWHLFYVTGPFENGPRFMKGLQTGDFQACIDNPYEVGDGHAIGPTLWDLRYHDTVLDIRKYQQEGLGTMGQGTLNVHRFEDGWVGIYTTRDTMGLSLCLAHSPDLYEWTYEPANPIWRPPSYCKTKGKCKNAHIIQHPTTGQYLIYYCVTPNTGATAIGLLSTEDFKSYKDHGLVFAMPHQLRGTQGVESPCVVCRDGMWHLFVGVGPGIWHSMSNRPDGFMGGGQSLQQGSVEGCYLWGRFHAVEVFEGDGRWYMTSTRKDQSRYENRRAGISHFRGTLEDEALWLDGLYMCELRWDGDQPIPQKASKP